MLVSKITEQDQPPFNRPSVFWGGPDRPSRYLRDLLEERIHTVPAGGEILWVTYYFRDEALAKALLQARDRGVTVRVAIEGNPRTGAVNSGVCELLGHNGGLGNGMRAIRHRLIDNRFCRTSRLHEKLYYFSHPTPSVLVGTFNPSGNWPEDPTIIEKIGDQDRGHNLLMDILDPILVAGLYEHGSRLFHAFHGPWERYLKRNNKVLTAGDTRILFFPRTQWQPFAALFEGLSSGDRLRIAVSHLNDYGICKHLLTLAGRGVYIEIIAHDTLRRVPLRVEEQMLRHGISFHRYMHPEGLPMHNKFMLFESSERRIVTCGSMNLSVRSLHANHELLVVNETSKLYEVFRQRWNEIMEEVKEQERNMESCRN